MRRLERYHSLSPVLWAWSCPLSDPEAASGTGEAWFLFRTFCCTLASGTRDGKQCSGSFQEKASEMSWLLECIKGLQLGCSQMTSWPDCMKEFHFRCSQMERVSCSWHLRQWPSAHGYLQNPTYYTWRMEKHTVSGEMVQSLKARLTTEKIRSKLVLPKRRNV